MVMGSILVLGGAGYIGSHTVYELIEAGKDVVVVDNLETGFRAAVHPEAKFYEGDIRNRAFIDSVFDKENIDGVIHFAANSQVGESMIKPLKYYSNNLCGTEVLLESMVAHSVDKIVFSSTAATYGEPERIPIMESDRTLPTNCYGETKLSMEKMFKWTANAHNLRFVSLRYFNACGAHPNGRIGEAHNPETHLIHAGTAKWPMSVIRLQGNNTESLVGAADCILSCWRGYTDEKAFIFSETQGISHNTITPIARKRGDLFELDLVLRNNITTEEFPLGVYHPHPEYHHIKKENIGLIEVMGLAVLPARLQMEMAELERRILQNEDLRESDLTKTHADWAEKWLPNYEITEENLHAIVQKEIGFVFAKVLECAGVYKRTPEGQAAFKKFLECI